MTKIEFDAFADCTNLKEITIPESVLEVWWRAFQNCTALEKAQLPDNWTIIHGDMFNNCKKLREVNLPKQLQEIQWGAFYNCVSLEKIEFPEQLSEIGNEAFYNCAGLKTLLLSQNVRTIKEKAFHSCTALESIEIPNSVDTLGDYCFSGNSSLVSIKIGSGVTTIPTGCFSNCSALEKIELPYSINTISEYCFVNDVALTEVYLKRGVTSIASNAFSYPDKITLYGVSGTYVEEFAEEEGINFVPINVPATNLSFDITEAIFSIGKNYRINMLVTPADYTDAVVWRSSNEQVATVSKNGVITPKSVGETTIIVKVGNLSTSCKVNVLQPVTVISLKLYGRDIILDALDTWQLTATVEPKTASDKTVNWSSSDETVATVDQNGKVTALRKGTAVITARANDGSGVSDSGRVNVTCDAVFCDSVEDLESLHNYPNDCTSVWVYTIPGMGLLDVTFDENTEIEEYGDYLYLYDGMGEEIDEYTGKQLAGRTIRVTGDTVRVKLVSDEAGSAWGFKVTSVKGTEAPKVKVTGVKLDKDKASLKVGGTVQLTATVEPADATDKTVTWSSSAPTVVTVENGLVKAVAAGTATITVTTKDGSKTATCAVTVEAADSEEPADPDDPATPEDPATPDDPNKPSDTPVSNIRLNKTSLILPAEETETLTAVIEPSDATNKSVTWSSSDPSVAMVDAATGLITAVKAGTARITATAADGSKVSASCDVTVRALMNGSLWIADVPDYTYTGEAIKPDVQVYFGSTLLVAGLDYTISYKNNIKAAIDSATKAPVVVVTGKGNYSGTATRKFNIDRIPIAETCLASSLFPKGKTYTPVITYTVGEDTIVLKAGTDYTIKYDGGSTKQPKTAGEHTLTATGKGSCTGTVTFNYTIGDTGKSISKASAKVPAMTYGGDLPSVTLKIGGNELEEDKDYIVVFSNTDKKGTAKAKFIGIGDYSGTKNVNFKVNAAKITADNVTVESSASYDKGGAKAAVSVEVGGRTLVSGVDYTVAYSNNKKPDATAKVTVTGKGNYSGTVKNKTFKVTAKDLCDEGVQIFVSDALTGKKPMVTIYDTNGAKLAAASDYKFSVDADNPIVTVTGGKNGLYTASAPIEIVYREVEKNLITSAKLKKGHTSYAYTGEPITLEEEWFDVKVGKKSLDSSDFEIIGYVNNVKKGTATAVIRAKEDSEYGGLKFVSFKISAYNFSKAR